MRHISLFSGIGGFDLAAQWMGWENVAHCEIDTLCRRLLKYYWPQAHSYEDIKKTDFSQYRGTIDIISGGFPCQPFSVAGKRKGTEDERHLWPEMLRAIREIRPSYVVGENVGGIITWDGGMVFEQVHTDLEAEGYEVQAFVLPAAGVNAPHRRDRVWFVAYSTKDGSYRTSEQTSAKIERQDRPKTEQSSKRCQIWTAANANKDRSRPYIAWLFRKSCGFSKRIEGRISKIRISANANEAGRQKFNDTPIAEWAGQPTWNIGSNWHDFPTQSPICGGNDGLPAKLDGITFPKWRNWSIASYGNAIVPQLAYRIFKAIDVASPNR